MVVVVVAAAGAAAVHLLAFLASVIR